MWIEMRDLGVTPITQLLDKAARNLGLRDKHLLSRVPRESCINAIFVAMFTQQWQYTTQITVMGRPQDLMHGFVKAPRRDGVEGINVNCFYYANFLRIALEHVGIEDTEVVTEVANRDEIFVTKRLAFGHANITGEFICIDRAVRGNVRTTATPYATEGRCCFSQHSALRVGTKVYDPTLRAVYTNGIADCIDFYAFADPLRDNTWVEHGHGGRTLSRLSHERPVGFTCGYLLQ